MTLPRAAVAGQTTDVTYRFHVAADAPAFTENYTVFVHAIDGQGRRVWTGDHAPPTPTTEWKPSAVIEYTQPMLIPRLATGTIELQVGLYSPRTQKRLTLSAADAGNQAYRVGSLIVRADAYKPQVVYAEGFHPMESPEDAQGVEWRWSQASGTFWLPRPKHDGDVVVELDQPIKVGNEPQQVTIALGDKVLGTFPVPSGAAQTLHVPLSAEDAGTSARVGLTLSVDRTFVPAKLQSGATDTRELGVRVFGVRFEEKEGGGGR